MILLLSEDLHYLTLGLGEEKPSAHMHCIPYDLCAQMRVLYKSH